MPDAKQEYPFHQPQRRNGNGRHSPHDDQTEPIKDARRDRQGPMYQDEEVLTSQLPRGRFKNALIAGVIAGALCSAQSIAITLANASTYQAYDTAKQQAMKNALALTIAGYGALTFIISMLICLIAGYITGRVSVQRSLGFLAGFVAGIVTYGISFLLNFIPNYPGHIASSGPANTGIVVGGLVVILIFFLIWGVIAGLVSLFGAWLATRRHPYYAGY